MTIEKKCNICKKVIFHDSSNCIGLYGKLNRKILDKDYCSMKCLLRDEELGIHDLNQTGGK